MIGRFVADDALRDDIRLIIGVLHRFQPDLGALGKVVRMRRAVADGIDVGQARLAEAIDAHTVGAVRTRSDQRLDRGHDTDTDDDEIGGDHLTAGQADAGDLRLTLDRIDAHAEPEIDAMVAVLLFVEAREFFASNAREHAVERFEEHDLLARLAQHRRGFEPDISAADHDDLARGLGRRLHRVGIGARANALHAGQVAAGDREHARRPAGGPDELAIADRLAAIGGDGVRGRIDACDAFAEQHRHFALVPIFGGAQLDAFELLLAREIFFRQRRAFVRKFGLFADDRDAAFELLRTQHDRNLRPAMTRAHYHHVELHRLRLRLLAGAPRTRPRARQAAAASRWRKKILKVEGRSVRQPGEPFGDHRAPRRHRGGSMPPMEVAHSVHASAGFAQRIGPLAQPFIEPRIEPHLAVKLQRQYIVAAPECLMRIGRRRCQQFDIVGKVEGVAMPMEHRHAGKVAQRR